MEDCMKQLMLKSTLVLAFICLALSTTRLLGQGLEPIIGDLTPCPGTEEYSITGEALYCSEEEYEITVTPLDVNGNEVTLDYPIGVPSLTARATQGNLQGGLEDWPVKAYYFDIEWAAPPSSQFRWARICFRAKCYRVTSSQTVVGPEWYTRCVVVEIHTVDPVTLTGPTQFECCSTAPLTFCATPSNYTAYQWTVPSGWTVQGPSNQSCITVIPNGTGGTVTAKPYNSACNTWGPATFRSVSATTCTGGSIQVLQPVQCNVSASGSLKANPPSGFSINGITWRDGTGAIINQGQTTLTGLTPGMYTVEMDLGNGCIAQKSIHLTGPQDDAALDITFTSSFYDAGSWKQEHSNCMYHIQAVAHGGLPPYTYQWSTGSNDNYINVAGPATVSLTITDARGCKYTESFSVDECIGINENDISELTASPNPNHGTFTADVDVNNSGVLDIKVFNTMNIPVYSYSMGSVSSGTHQHQVDISGKPNGTYFLTATLSGGSPVTVQIVKQ